MAAEREVVIKLKLVSDASSAAAARSAADVVAAAQKKASAVTEESATAQAKTVKASVDQQVEDYERAAREQQRASERATAASRAAFNVYAEGSKQALSGITALARGFVLLGISNEKDLEKAMRTLAKFEAGASAARGLFDVVQAGVKIYNAYAAAATAAAAAETAATAARAAGGRVGAAAGAASAAGGVASAVGGVAGGGGAAAAGGVTLAGAGAVAGVVALIAAAGAAAVMWTEKIDGSADELDSFTSRVGEAGSALAAMASRLFDSGGDPTSAGAAARRAAVNSNPATASLAMLGGLWSSIAGGGDLADREDKTARMEEARRKQGDAAIFRASQNQTIAEQLSFEDQQRREALDVEQRRAAAAARVGLSGPEADVASIRATMKIEQRALGAATADSRVAAAAPDAGIGTAAERFKAEDRRATSLEKMISLQEQLGQAEQQTAQVAIQRARDTLQAEQQALATVQQRLRASEQELGGAAKSLSDLNDPNKIAAISKAADAARRGEQLDVSQAKLLEKTGLSEFQKAISDAYVRNVEKLGGGDIIASKKSEVENLRGQERDLKMDVQVAHEVLLTLEGKPEEIAKQVAAKIEPLMDKLADAIAKRAEAKLLGRDQDDQAKRAQEARAGA